MFNPHDFIQPPSMIVLSDAAAIEVDRQAIKRGGESKRLFLVYTALHLEDVAMRIQAQESEIARLGGGVFLTDMPGVDLTVIDAILPPTYTRVFAICTRAEAQEALMNIEDFSNHSGYQFIEMEPKS